jgi:hypothetical protein
MREVNVVWCHNHGQWEASEHGQAVESAPTKEDCVRKAAEWAKAQGEPVSVRIHELDGRFEEERTYPRAADPEESAG